MPNRRLVLRVPKNFLLEDTIGTREALVLAKVFRPRWDLEQLQEDTCAFEIAKDGPASHPPEFVPSLDRKSVV